MSDMSERDREIRTARRWSYLSLGSLIASAGCILLPLLIGLIVTGLFMAWGWAST